MTAEKLAAMDQIVAERACERLVVEFVHRLDLGMPSTVADLFTSDGVWAWPAGGRLVRGRDALREYFGSRPADRLSRRMCVNILVTVISASTAKSICYFATYRVDGHSGGILPPRPPVNVGHYEDTFRKLDGQWLLAARSLFLAFAGPTENVSG